MNKLYPNIKIENLENVLELLEYIVRERRNDVNDFKGLGSKFMSGRKVGKIPSSSADVAADDRIGDFNYDANYFYICVDNSGAVWRRITLGSW